MLNYGRLLRWLCAQHILKTDAIAVTSALAFNNDKVTIVSVTEMLLYQKELVICGSLSAGKRAAAITSLIRSAQLNGHDPLAYLRDVLTRLPKHRAADMDGMLSHRWKPFAAAASARTERDDFTGCLPRDRLGACSRVIAGRNPWKSIIN